MSRRSYTEVTLRAVVLSELRDELGGAPAVSSLPPPDGIVQPDQIAGGRVYVGVPVATETVQDGRRNRPVATTTDCTYTVRVQFYTRRVAGGLEAAYVAHLNTRRQIAGRLARLVDEDGETVPATSIQSGTVWTGEMWASTLDATIPTRAPTTLP